MAGRRYSEWTKPAGQRRPLGISKAGEAHRNDKGGLAIQSGSAAVRDVNRNAVLQLFKSHGSMSRADAARFTGLTKPTVSAIVDGLIADLVLLEDGSGISSRQGGRPAAILRFNARHELVLAVHIGVDRTKVVLADSRGAMVARREFRTRQDDADQALARVATAARDLIAYTKVNPAAVVSMLVTLPGMVDVDLGICHWAPNLGWQNIDVARPLEQALGIRVTVHNVVQVVALAETLEGAGQEYSRVLVIYEDNGIGAAFVSDGSVSPGCRGVFGEIGHARLPGFDEPCSCGGRGCFEAVASSRALHAKLAARSAEHLSRNAYADHGHADPAIAACVDEAAILIGTVTSWLINLYGPEAVVISGGFLEGNAGFLRQIEQTASDGAVPLFRPQLSFRRSTLQFDAPIRGAIVLALQQAHQTLAKTSV